MMVYINADENVYDHRTSERSPYVVLINDPLEIYYVFMRGDASCEFTLMAIEPVLRELVVGLSSVVDLDAKIAVMFEL
jgi:hypothetical protein